MQVWSDYASCSRN